MAALGIHAELRLVDPDEGEVAAKVAFLLAAHRHGFGRAQEPAGLRRQDLLLAGDQRDFIGPLDLDDPVIDLACQQPQREADQPGRMAAHPLDGEMGLAGVGRAQDGLDGRVPKVLHHP